MIHSSCRLRCRLIRLPSCTFPARRTLLTLAIETSCDDTAVAILDRSPVGDSPNGKQQQQQQPQRHRLLFNERITSDNKAFQGIMPSVAAKGHEMSLAPLLKRAIECLPDADSSADRRKNKTCLGENGVGKQLPDFLSVTRGPGIAGNLTIGLAFAKGLSVAWDIPLVGVHHMQAHALTPRLATALGMSMGISTPVTATTAASTTTTTTTTTTPTLTTPAHPSPEFPFLSLLVSGGHSQLVHSRSLTDHRIVVNTLDTAIGNSLDQAARLILPTDVLLSSQDVSYGRYLEDFAFPPGQRPEDKYAFFRPAVSRKEEIADTVDTGYDWKLSQPMRDSRRLAYSFTCVYTDVERIFADRRRAMVSKSEEEEEMPLKERRALARHTFASAFKHLVGRIIIALQDRPELGECKTLVVSGGVASNKFLMHVLQETLRVRGFGDMMVVAPPVELCTDNAAMIAWTGLEMWDAGWKSNLGIGPIKKWPMDKPGILGVDGWVQRS